MICLAALLLTTTPSPGAMRCPEGTSYSKTFTEESCLDSEGKPTGPQELRGENGELIHRQLFDHGKLESSISYFPDGSPRDSRGWVHGRRDGSWEVYYEPKKLAWRRVFADDKLTKETLFDRDGHEQKQPKVLPDGGVGPGGGLSKDVILLVIKAHQNEVKFCYEKQLQPNPALEGKVAVAFTIGANGNITEVSAAENTVPDAEVAACILGRIKRWEFPRPLGGGDVSITFPWIFQHADAKQ